MTYEERVAIPTEVNYIVVVASTRLTESVTPRFHKH